jgi:hypothetical protein
MIIIALLILFFILVYLIHRKNAKDVEELVAIVDGCLTQGRRWIVGIEDLVAIVENVLATTGRRLNYENLRRYFRFPDEIQAIIQGIDRFIARNKDTLCKYPFIVDVFPFTFAVRQHEAGRTGTEFGIMHPDAINTNLEIQLEWFLSTLMKDSIRWHTGKLWNDWKKEDFPDFISYFAKKYAPPEASELNKHWEPNVRKYYDMFRKE